MTLDRSRSLALLLLLPIFGCKAETFGGQDQPTLADGGLTVNPARPLPGAAVEFRSAALVGIRSDSGTIAVEGETAAAYRIDDSTFRAALPSGLVAGTHSLLFRAGFDSTRILLATGGYAGSTPTGLLGLESAPQPWPAEYSTGVLSHGPDGYLYYVDGTSGRAVPLITAWRDYGYAPGTSYRPNVAALRDALGQGLFATVDRGRGAISTDSVIPGFDRQAYEFAPGCLLVTHHHSSTTSCAGGATGAAFSLMESPWYFRTSPDHRFGTFIVNAVQSSTTSVYALPIVDLATGTVARKLSGIGSTDALAWSADGHWLYVDAKPYYSGPERLAKVNAETGEEVMSVPLPDTWWLTLDPRAGTLYEVGKSGADWRFRIRDPETLALIADMTMPADGCVGIWSFPIVVFDPNGPQAHVFASRCDGAVVEHFDLRQ